MPALARRALGVGASSSPSGGGLGARRMHLPLFREGPEMGKPEKKSEVPVEPNGPGRPVHAGGAVRRGRPRTGDEKVASAFQKEIRRGDVRAAMYWGHLLYGEASYYAWKRTLVVAAEDVGLAAPDVVEKVCGLALAWRICREKSYYVSPHHFSMAGMLLCAAPKSTEVQRVARVTSA